MKTASAIVFLCLGLAGCATGGVNRSLPIQKPMVYLSPFESAWTNQLEAGRFICATGSSTYRPICQGNSRWSMRCSCRPIF